jgi:hypothetical protein
MLYMFFNTEAMHRCIRERLFCSWTVVYPSFFYSLTLVLPQSNFERSVATPLRRHHKESYLRSAGKALLVASTRSPRCLPNSRLMQATELWFSLANDAA